MSAVAQTKEIYRKIFNEMLVALREDPLLQRELSKGQVDFIEQTWKKLMDDSALNIYQGFDLSYVFPGSKLGTMPFLAKPVSGTTFHQRSVDLELDDKSILRKLDRKEEQPKVSKQANEKLKQNLEENSKNANQKIELFIRGGEQESRAPIITQQAPVQEPKVEIKLDIKPEPWLEKREASVKQAIEDTLFVK